MNFTIDDIHTLRERTGLGLMECKKALERSDGDIDKAIQYIIDHPPELPRCIYRQRKLPSHLKYETNINGINVVIDIAGETENRMQSYKILDFCRGLANTISQNVKIIENKIIDTQFLYELRYQNTEKSVQEMLNYLILQLGESMSIKDIFYDEKDSENMERISYYKEGE